MNPHPRLPSFLAFSSLVLLTFIVMLNGLGNAPFVDYDEAAYAQITRETIASGNYLSPVFQNDPWFDKPPLYFLLSSISQGLIRDAELALRLPAAIFGIIAILLTALIVYERTKHTESALLAGILLLSCGAFLEAARQVKIDAPITAIALLAVYCWMRGKKDPRWYVGVGIALGLALMFKGVAGFLVLALTALLSIAYREFLWLRTKATWIGFGIGFIAVIPWHIYQTVRFGAVFWHQYLGVQVIGRVQTNLFGDQASSLVYAEHLFWYALPLLLLIIPTLYAFIRFRLSYTTDSRRFLGGILLAISSILLLLIAVPTKVVHYLVPLYPLVVIGIAEIWLPVYARLRSSLYRRFLIGAFAFFLAVSLSHAVYATTHHFEDRARERAIAKDEMKIGMILAPHTHLPTFFLQPTYWETVRYYSGGRSLRLFDPSNPPTGAYFLVFPTEDVYASTLRSVLTVSSYRPIFVGAEMSLIFVNNASALTIGNPHACAETCFSLQKIRLRH